MSLRKLLKRPLASAAELAELEARFARSRRRWRRFGYVLAALAAFLVFVNLMTTAFQPGVSLADRIWSLNVVTLIAAFWTPFFFRAIWGRRRRIQAQRRLLRQRGLLSDGTSDVAEVAEALDLLVERIAALLVGRKDLADLLADATERARAMCRRLEEGSLDEASAEHDRAVLTAFRFALATFEIDAFTRPGYVASAKAAKALRRAADLLVATGVRRG